MNSIPVTFFIGKSFFYNDEEAGIGWSSKIDDIYRDYQHAGFKIELSCGTIVDVSFMDFYRNKEKMFVTNMKEMLNE